MSISPILTNRKEKEKARRKQQILSIAKQIAIKEGWESVTIRRIAAEIQYSLPVIYSHFVNKENLIFDIEDEYYSSLTKDQPDNLKNKTQNLLNAIRDLNLKYPEFSKIFELENLEKYLKNQYQLDTEIKENPDFSKYNFWKKAESGKSE